MKTTVILALGIAAILTGCQMLPTQQAAEPQKATDVKTAQRAAVTSERCVFTPEQQRNAAGKDLGDRILANDNRQCNDLVSRLSAAYINEIKAHAADLNK
jgi:hypothetical protein